MSKNQNQINDKNSLKIYTKLDELYSKESKNTTIKSQYEDFHSNLITYIKQPQQQLLKYHIQ